MMEGWIKMNLGSLTSTQKGYAFKSNWYQDNGVAIARVSDFTDNSISEDNLLYVSEEIAKDYSKYKLKRRDIIIQTVGSGPNNPASIVGKVISVPENLNEALLNQNAVKLLPNDLIDNRFLYYRLKDEHFKYYCLNHSKGGANQMSITLDSIRRFEFLLPPLPTQRKIASILSAYDDLIENNLKRIKLLEEKAQLTYEEWFVRMKFPGHETTPIKNETGLPEGWERKNLGDFLTLNYGKALKADSRIPGPFNVYGSSGAVGSHAEALVKGPGVIVGRKGNVGSVFFEPHDFYPIDTVYYVGTNESLYFSYYNLKSQSFINNDAAVPGLNRNSAYLKKSFLPSREIQNQFDCLIDKYFKQSENLDKQNQLLKESRDILLPRLMTGIIDVDQLELENLQPITT